MFLVIALVRTFGTEGLLMPTVKVRSIMHMCKCRVLCNRGLSGGRSSHLVFYDLKVD